MSECSRRSFLRTTCGISTVVGVMAALPRDLRALPVHFVDGAPIGSVAERAFPIPAADSVNIDRKISAILVRSNGKVFAFSLTCPHERAAVKWIEKEAKFMCTKHDSKYLPEGKYISGRSTRNMDRFPIRKDAGNVVINLDAVFHSDTDAAGWSAAEVAV